MLNLKKGFLVGLIFTICVFMACAPSGEERTSTSAQQTASQTSSAAESKALADLTQSGFHWTSILTEPKDRDELEAGGSDKYDAAVMVMKLNSDGTGTTTFHGILKGETSRTRIGNPYPHGWKLDYPNKKLILLKDPKVAESETLSGEMTNMTFIYGGETLTEFKGTTNSTLFSYKKEKD